MDSIRNSWLLKLFMDYHARKVNLINLKFNITIIPKFTGASSPSDCRRIVLQHLLVMLNLKVLAIQLQKLMPKANEWVPVCFSQKIEVPRIASYAQRQSYFEDATISSQSTKRHLIISFVNSSLGFPHKWTSWIGRHY